MRGGTPPDSKPDCQLRPKLSGLDAAGAIVDGSLQHSCPDWPAAQPQGLFLNDIHILDYL